MRSRRGSRLFLIVLFAVLADAPRSAPISVAPITFAASMEDGTQVEFTLNKTGSGKGHIRKRHWKKRRGSGRRKPPSEDVVDVYDMKSLRDGMQLVGRADIPLRDPVITFTLHFPEPAADSKPELTEAKIVLIVKGTTFGLGDRTTIYWITVEDCAGIREFIRQADCSESGDSI